MNLERIALQFINDNKFDGLVNTTCECACDKSDLAPCGQPHMTNCEAAYKTDKAPSGVIDDSDIYFVTTKPIIAK
jgi:hypothetical protein